MNRNTGQALGDLEHLQQSVTDILTTPIGSRLMRRDYGCDLFRLLDQPLNAALGLQAKAVAVIALLRWEPRLNLTHIDLVQGERPGQAFIELEGYSTVNDAAVSLRAPLLLGGLS
ncbi:GPW/gp25 family protein [Pseudomonas oryzihabitans]|uniref:GPW/gp25 family protein n=1 Tax=Pseudomonas oryzihabitans TaxID=47885 RepID=UPI002893D994|nr:GPW/gp25 family protein [Pseudomonas oryzihabitans]MDT3721415.1 GPW/gp25 family protein [Pseudomonas oryzihabitans]